MGELITVNDIKDMASALGPLFQKSPRDMFALMLIAQAEGKHPAQAAQEYDIIDGKPALKSQAMLARFQASGGKVHWIERTDERVKLRLTHPIGGEIEITWDKARAEKAGLWNKRGKSGGPTPWVTFPQQMLANRAISEGVRALYPVCLSGLYTVEEVRDFDPINVTPEQSSHTVFAMAEDAPVPSASDTTPADDGFDAVAQVTFSVISEHAKAKGDPKGWTDQERNVLGIADTFKLAKANRDADLMRVLKDKVKAYASLRDTEKATEALALIGGCENTMDALADVMAKLSVDPATEAGQAPTEGEAQPEMDIC